MVTVTIVTGGHHGGHVRFAQGHRLAVVGFPIMLQPVLMALAAAFVADGFEIVALRIYDSMRGMAIRADRPARVPFGQQLAVYALIVGRLDAEMTLAAGPGDIGVVDW